MSGETVHPNARLIDFEFSIRTENCLVSMSLFTVGDLLNKTELDIAGSWGVGKKTLYEIKDWLCENNLKLKAEPQEDRFTFKGIPGRDYKVARRTEGNKRSR